MTGFSKTVTPRHLVAASYPVGASDVEGDCGRLAAVERLPETGAYVALVDYGPGTGGLAGFTDTLPAAALADGQLVNVECFGRSYAFLWVSGGRALQAHAGVGASASSRTVSDALSLLNSIVVDDG